MKTKHLQKIFISSIFSTLILVIFFLNPFGAKAQPGINVVADCVKPQDLGLGQCCVNTAYLSDIPACWQEYIVDMDGDILSSSNGDNYYVWASVDTRFMTTIKEFDNGRVELRAYFLGPGWLSAVEQHLLYDWNKYDLIRSNGAAVIPIPPVLSGPGTINNWQTISMIQNPGGKVMEETAGTTYGSYFFQFGQLDQASRQYAEIWAGLNVNIPSQRFIQKNEIQPLYKIFFQKKNPTAPVVNTDFGYYSDALTNSWDVLGGPVNQTGVVKSRMTNGTLGTSTSWITVPKMYEYRTPSSVITNIPLSVNSKRANLHGLFKQGVYPPTNQIPTATIFPTAPTYPQPRDISVFQLKPIGLRAWDGITEYGFIYTTANTLDPNEFEIKFNTINDFVKTFTIVVEPIGPIQETFDIDDLFSGAPLVVHGETFYIQKVSTNVSGDYSYMMDVVANQTYSYWAFSINYYGTENRSAVDFINIGAKQMFDAVDCATAPELIFAADELCQPNPKIELDQAIYDEYVLMAGSGTVIFDWYYLGIDKLTETWVAEGRTLDLTGKPAGYYRLFVTIPIDNSGDYCEVEETVLIEACGGPFLVIETISNDTVCSDSGFPTVNITITSYAESGDHDIVVQITPEAGLIETGFNQIDGTYLGGLWEVTVPAGETVELELYYNAINTGTVPITLNHLVEIIVLDGTPVVIGQIISDEIFITVLPEPYADDVSPIAVCTETVVGPITITGLFTSFAYSGGATIGLADGIGTTQIPAFTAINTSNATITATINVIPYYLYNDVTCPGDPMEFTISVSPIPVLTPTITNKTFCYDTDSDIIPLSQIVVPLTATVHWEVMGGAGANMGLTQFIGTGDFPSFKTENTGTVVLSTVVKVFATEAGCTSETKYFVINVMPDITIDAPTSIEICHNTYIPTINFSSYADNASFSWEAKLSTNANPTTIGMQPLGNDFIPGFTATNYTDEVIIATVTVYAFMDDGFKVCKSPDATFTITVVPELTVTPENDRIACAGEDLVIDFYSPFDETTFKWEASPNAGLIGMELIGDDVIDFTTENYTQYPITVEVKVTPSYSKCYGEPMYFNIIVNPIPTVNTVQNIEVCAGETINAINFTGDVPGTVYEWTNDNTDIGLASIGYGFIPTFTAVNTTDELIEATITVTPKFAGVGLLSEACIPDDPQMEFVITVYPMPVMLPVSNIDVCDGTDVLIEFETSPVIVDGLRYAWTVDNETNAAAIGIDLTDNDWIINMEEGIVDFAAENTTNHPITVVFTITPSYWAPGDDWATCTGNPVTFSITVVPKPVVNAVASAVYCAGDNVPAITFTGNIIGATYKWEELIQGGTAVGATGYNTLPGFLAVNTTDAPIILNYQVTPYFEYNGVSCEGEVITFSITINPMPVMLPISNLAVCAGDEIEVDFTSSMTEMVVYDWYVDNVANAAAIGMGTLTSPSSDISFTAVNTTDNAITVVITVTPSSVDGQGVVLCTGNPVTFSITVAPKPVVLTLVDQNKCVGEMTAAVHFGAMNAPTGTKFYWSHNLPGIGIATPGEGDILPFEVLISGQAIFKVTAEYPNGANACTTTKDTTFRITGHARPVMTPIEDITVCNGTTVEAFDFLSTAIWPVYTWRFVGGTNFIDITGETEVTEFPEFTAVNTSNSVLSGVYGVKVREGLYCEGEEIFFVITVNPIPVVDAVASVEYCAGANIPAYTFTGNIIGATYKWEELIQGGTAVGATGYNTLPGFLAVNTTDAPIILNYQVTPYFEYNGVSCEGDSITFSITINPMPVMLPISNLAVCAGDEIEVDFTSSMTEMVVYDWYVDNVANAAAIGMGTLTSPSADITFTSVNNTNNAITVVITVTPSSVDGQGVVLCTGNPVTFSITVAPKPIMLAVTNQEVCVGDWTAVVDFSALNAPAGTIFHWTCDNTSIGCPPAGANIIHSFKVTADVVATFTVTAEFPNGANACMSGDTTFTITGRERPVMTPLMNITVCNGNEVEIPEFASTAIDPVYEWRFVDGVNIGLDELFGQGNMLAFDGINTGTAPLSAVYGVKVSEAGYCWSEEIFFTITVNPIPVADEVGTQIYCTGTQVPLHIFTGNVPNTTYYWLQTNYQVQNVPELPQEGHNIFPAFMAVNLTLEPIVLEYEVTPTFEYNGVVCTGEPIYFTITINPKPEVVAMPNLSFCAGDQTDVIEFTGTAYEYRWFQISGDLITDNSIDLQVGGVDEIPSFVTVNNGNTSLIAVIRVTPWTEDGYCSGDYIEFTIKVKPTPTVYQVADQILCAGEHTTDVIFAGDTPGTVFHWTNSAPEIGLNDIGIGNIYSFIAENHSTVPIVATIVVIPEFKGDPYDACEGDTMKFTITVNPIPTVHPIPDIAYCEGVSETTPIIFEGTIEGTEFHWIQTGGDIITYDIDLMAGGIGDIPSFSTVNTGNTVLVAHIQVTPWYYLPETQHICYGVPIEFTISVVPEPTVDQVNNQELCAGGDTYDVIFTGNTSGTIYTWTVTTTNDEYMGLPTSGVSNIWSFTAVNNTDNPIVATIKVVPKLMQGDPNNACIGDTMTFYITVNPLPTVNPVSNIVYCTGTPNNPTIVDIAFTGNMSENVAYTWYVDNEANAIAIGMGDLLTGISGEGNIYFEAVNDTNNPLTVCVTVTPWSLNYQGANLCSGEPITFCITISPVPNMLPIASQEVCVYDMTAIVDFSSLPFPAGTIFYWERTGDDIGNVPTSGWNNIQPFQVTSAGVATFTVTAELPNGAVPCIGLSETFTITGYDRPIMVPIENITVCNGYPVVVPDFNNTAGLEGVTYKWRFVDGSYIGLDDLLGDGNMPTFTGVNPGIAPLSAIYAVKANGGAHCDGPEIFFTITVAPTPHIDLVANKVFCENMYVDEFCFSGHVPGTIFAWTYVSGDNIHGGSLPNTGTGCMPPFHAVTNESANILTATYRVTATYILNGVSCGGEQQDFTISVLPRPTVNNLLSQVVCHKDFVVTPMFGGVATSWEWAFIDGQEIGVHQNNGVGQFPSFFAENYGNAQIAALYEVIPYYEAGGVRCAGVPGYFSITVNPQPTLNTVPSEMVFCNGEPVQYNFTGTFGAEYHWTTSGDYIGLPPSGIGPLYFIAQNPTDDLLTADIEVWAVYKNSDGTICKSDEQTFSIHVMPTAIVDLNDIPKEFCHNESVPAYHFKGNVPPTSLLNVRYEWMKVSGDDIGTATSGVNTIPAFTAYNPGTAPRTAYYTVTMFVEYKGLVCGKGDEKTFSITVDPKATLDSDSEIDNFCSGSKFYYKAEASIEGITFTWERPAIPGINGGAAGSGTGAVINEVLTNTTNTPIIVEYHFTMYGKCTDPSEIFVLKVEVLPNANIEIIDDETIVCNSDNEVLIAYNNVQGLQFEYKVVFNKAALEQGFVNQLDFVVMSKDFIPISMPAGVNPGKYYATLIIRNIDCKSEKEYPITLDVRQGTFITGDLEDTLLCIGNDLILTVSASGDAKSCPEGITYTWYKNGIAIATTKTGIYIKQNATADDEGAYHVIVKGCCGEAASRTVMVVVGQSLILQKWDDVLYVDNSGGLYHGYQWYKLDATGNKVRIVGAVSQYYQEKPLNGVYGVDIYDFEGNLIETCPIKIVTPAKNIIEIYPNPVSQGGTLTVYMDMEPEMIAGSLIEVYDMVGKQIESRVVDGHTTKVTMQMIPGAYVVRITNASGEALKNEKVIVR